MGRKPSVKSSIRHEWLRRNEEGGESPPQIAKSDGFDARTVRKQIQLARQEKDVTESRQTLLRQAMENHHKDLVAFSEKLQKEAARGGISSSLKANPFWTALREHLPKSALWKSMDRLERLDGDLKDLDGQLNERLHQAVEGLESEKHLTKSKSIGIHPEGLAEATKAYCLSAQKSQPPRFRNGPVKTGVMEIYCNEWICAVVPDSEVEETTKLLTLVMKQACLWPEWQEIVSKRADRDREINIITEEVLVIKLRRIVPGRCKYCPV